jgi:hypothetical protein
MATNKFSIASGHCGTSDKSSFFKVTLDNDCIRIITDPNGPKVVLHLDKTSKAIDARFFQSAKTSTKYHSAIALDSSNIRKSLKNVVELLLPTNTSSDKAHADADADANANANVDDLIKAVKLFIDNNPSYNSWKQPFTNLGLGAVDMSELKEFAPQPAVQAPVQAPVQVPVSVNGGATKKSRRRRKCAKIYTRRDKKYNSKRKSRQVRRRIYVGRMSPLGFKGDACPYTREGFKRDACPYTREGFKGDACPLWGLRGTHAKARLVPVPSRCVPIIS